MDAQYITEKEIPRFDFAMTFHPFVLFYSFVGLVLFLLKIVDSP